VNLGEAYSSCEALGSSYKYMGMCQNTDLINMYKSEVQHFSIQIWKEQPLRTVISLVFINSVNSIVYDFVQDIISTL
jgi:hypothetical protein